jgi:hypothetical protein
MQTSLKSKGRQSELADDYDLWSRNVGLPVEAKLDWAVERAERSEMYDEFDWECQWWV